MKQIVNNFNYIDIINSETGVTLSILKASVKKVHRVLGAVFLNMLDDVPYFLDYREIEDPLTPGIPYTNVAALYVEVLSYLTT